VKIADYPSRIALFPDAYAERKLTKFGTKITKDVRRTREAIEATKTPTITKYFLLFKSLMRSRPMMIKTIG